MLCLECKTDFKPIRTNQRFCCLKCKDKYHNREKMGGLMLTPRLREGLRSLAGAHDVSENEMASRMLDKMMNPDGQPLTEEEITGMVGPGFTKGSAEARK